MIHRAAKAIAARIFGVTGNSLLHQRHILFMQSKIKGFNLVNDHHRKTDECQSRKNSQKTL